MGGGRNTRNAPASRQEEIKAKMVDLETSIKEGLESLRSEYHRSGEPAQDTESFEMKLQKFESEIGRSLNAIKIEVAEIQKEIDKNRKKKKTERESIILVK